MSAQGIAFQGIGRSGRTITEIDDTAWRAARNAITRQESDERKRQARIRRERARRKAKFVMPPPAVSAAARIDRGRLMGRR